MDSAADAAFRYYDSRGWQVSGGITEDARRWEDLRVNAAEYVSKCRLRILRHIPECGINMLDMASGPIQYEEYLRYSANFKKRYCLDLCAKALEEAKKKIGEHGLFLAGDFFAIALDDNFFDCAISLHTIYHMHKDRQEEAVRKLVMATKRDKPVIIVYINPNAISKTGLLFRALMKIKRMIDKDKRPTYIDSLPIYFFAHPIQWWERFTDIAEVKIFPWCSLDSDTQKKLIPDNLFGKIILRILFNMEDIFPEFFGKRFAYHPMIILTKK